MNALSVRELTLPGGGSVRLKICLGSLELFAESIGAQTVEDALSCFSGLGGSAPDGKPLPMTIAGLKALRKLLFAAAQYVRLVEKQPVDFSEYEAAEWVQALLSSPDFMTALFDDLSFGPMEEAKSDPKKKR